MRALGALGHVAGQDFTIDQRDQPRQLENTPEVLAELIRLKPDALVLWGTVAAIAAKKLTSSVPVVFLSVGAPVEIGLVRSLANPGGNMTGVTFEAASETYAKRLQILKEISPRLSRVAILQAVGDANVAFAMTSLERAAPALGIKLLPIGVRSIEEINVAFGSIKKNGAEALLVVSGALTFRFGSQIAALAASHRLPSIHGFRETVEAGGLISLGPDYLEMARRGAALTSMILKGRKPENIPVEQPTRYEMLINRNTAKVLGLTLPQDLLLRADRVIE